MNGRLASACALVLLTTACSQGPNIVPLPDVSVQSFCTEEANALTPFITEAKQREDALVTAANSRQFTAVLDGLREQATTFVEMAAVAKKGVDTCSDPKQREALTSLAAAGQDVGAAASAQAAAIEAWDKAAADEWEAKRFAALDKMNDALDGLTFTSAAPSPSNG